MPPTADPNPGHQPTFAEIEATGRLALLLDYWRSLRPGQLPTRDDIDLMEMSPALLPYIFFADVLEGGQRFRWRLIGTHIVRNAGTDDTGLDLDVSVAPAMRETIIGHYRRVVVERRPLCHRSDFVGRDDRLYRYDRLLLPVLAVDAVTIDTVFGAAVFGERPGAP